MTFQSENVNGVQYTFGEKLAYYYSYNQAGRVIDQQLPQHRRRQRVGGGGRAVREMKRKAIEKAQVIEHANDSGAALWRTDASILTWLEAL